MVNKKQLKKLFDEKINKRLGVAKSEADTITGLINPFIDLLGYDREEFERVQEGVHRRIPW